MYYIFIFKNIFKKYILKYKELYIKPQLKTLLHVFNIKLKFEMGNKKFNS